MCAEDERRRTLERAMLIERACRLEGWSQSPQALVAKIDQLRRGLPKEDEFVALSVWMSKCSLIHKLDQKQFPELSHEKYQVPDIFACYDFKGKSVPVLVEIKTTSKAKFNPFSNAYYHKLVNYAEMLGLPLLVAWRIEELNLWSLFEVERMTKKNSAFHIDVATAMDNSLLGVLFNDHIMRVGKATQVLLKFRKDPKSESREKDGQMRGFSGVLEDVVWLSPGGERIALKSALGEFLHYAFCLVEDDTKEIENETYVTLVFYTTNDQDIFGHQLLGPVLAGSWRNPAKEPNWLEAVDQKEYTMDYLQVIDAASEGVDKGVVKMIGRQRPAVFPRFLSF